MSAIREYSEEQHRRLTRTIARIDAPPTNLDEPLRIMACHETPFGREKPCIGWLHNQLNEGNNILLRYLVVAKRISSDYTLDGPQHPTLEATLPKTDANDGVENGLRKSNRM